MTDFLLVFSPLIAPWLIGGVLAVSVLLSVFALWRRLMGWWLRGLAVFVLALGLAQPSVMREDRRALLDIVLVLVDETSSARMADRIAQTEAALADLENKIKSLGEVDLWVVRFGDAPDDAGTLAMAALDDALRVIPETQLAGVFLISDGVIHDFDAVPALPAPFHLLRSGAKTDWDIGITLENAPAFAIIGEQFTLKLRVTAQGAAPPIHAQVSNLTVLIDDAPAKEITVPVGQDIEIPITLTHGGANVVHFSVPAIAGELTAQNNTATLQINGVRDRLRVLLVSGEPNAGQRVWRNLLKSDPNVDLVHFTILRAPDSQDNTPNTQLSLIPFPTERLFGPAIDEFDLVIFDRYRTRGILNETIMNNVVRYVKDGGTVLVVAGPEFGSAESLWHSALGQILPGDPTARLLERGFRPEVTALGQRHPVTAGLDKDYAAQGGWGRWFRMVEIVPRSGQVVMSGPAERPLLLLDRVEKGRVALLASDHVWLWGRGFEGGGPQLDLLRRLAHWMLKEPALEEERLEVEQRGFDLSITRHSLSEVPERAVTIAALSGASETVLLKSEASGRYSGVWTAPTAGVYRLEDGEVTRLVAVATTMPRELARTVADGAGFAEKIGAVWPLEEGFPDIRRVRLGQKTSGRGWLGITPRAAFVGTDTRVTPVLHPVVFAGLVFILMLIAWWREGRKYGG